MTQTDSLGTENEAVIAPEVISQEKTNEGVARATGVLVLGNIASRALGMAREVAVTGLFGASRATDAFYVATLVPRTIYDLLIGGQLNGAIIPVLPYLFGAQGISAVIIAAVLVGVALLGTGSIVGLLSGTSPLTRALRQLAIGYGAATATYLLGLLFGVSAG